MSPVLDKFRASPGSDLDTALRAVVISVVVGVVLTPLVISRHAYDDGFFTPKWAWLASLATVGLAASVGRAFLGKAFIFPLNPAFIAGAVFLVIHPLSALWSRSPSLATERSLHVLWLTAGLLLAVQAVSSRRALIRFGWLWMAVGFAVAVWVLKQDAWRAWLPERVRIISNLPDWRGYLPASLGNTNHVGDLLAVALLPALVYLGEARRRRALVAAIIIAVVIAAGLTVVYSVGSNLGLVVGAIVMLGLVVRRERLRFFRRWRRWAVLGALWAGMLGFFVFDHPANPHRPGILRQGFGSERWMEGGSSRIAIWAGALEIIRLHPVLGVGAGNFTYVYPEMRSEWLASARPDLVHYQGRWTNAAHNEWLQTWSELGMLGVAALLALYAVAFSSLLEGIAYAPRSEFLARLTLTGMLAAHAAQGMMNFVLLQPSGAVTFYLLLAAVIIERRSRAESRSAMPSLSWETRFVHLRVDWKDMKQPTAIGAAFPIPAPWGAMGAIALLALAALALPRFHRPVRAQAHYADAKAAEARGLFELEESHHRAGLALDPWATGMRSRYSSFLVEQGRGAEALEQIALVRRRLNSPELWEREARALAQLGRGAEAREAMNEFRRRITPTATGR